MISKVLNIFICEMILMYLATIRAATMVDWVEENFEKHPDLSKIHISKRI
jgi:hypothetical protein